MRKYGWKLKKGSDGALVEKLRSELNDLPTELTQMLIQRGIRSFEEARYFFRARLDALHNPYQMKDMDRAVARLLHALDTKEKIVTYGDYDVDGTSSTALFAGFLLNEGAPSDYFVPNRFEHGYGLSKLGIDHCAELGANLIVAVDCGITAQAEAEYAQSLGIDLIICDHHTPQGELPHAVAVLDPKRDDCSYPYKELCGCGVAFKLVQAMLIALERDPSDAVVYLDLVALATASDIVSVTGENRILLREGLDLIRTNPRIGIKCLAEETRTRLSECTVESILFNLGPRINAAGRLGDASRAVSLLLTDDEVEGAARARQLERLNLERRELDQETLDVAIKMAERQLLSSDRHSLVLHHPDWHVGVIGIVASRLVDRFYRPAIMLTTVNGFAKGSARSINGINVFQAIKACEDLLVEFGGHDYAAGLTIPVENVPAFAERFDEHVSEQITPDLIDPVIEIDAEIELSLVDRRFWAVLRQFEPFGPDNLRPIFLTSNLLVADRPRTVGRDGAHLKFSVREAETNGSIKDVIAFRMGEYFDLVLDCHNDERLIQLVYTLDENTWSGKTSLQLKAKDLRLQALD